MSGGPLTRFFPSALPVASKHRSFFRLTRTFYSARPIDVAGSGLVIGAISSTCAAGICAAVASWHAPRTSTARPSRLSRLGQLPHPGRLLPESSALHRAGRARGDPNLRAGPGSPYDVEPSRRQSRAAPPQRQRDLSSYAGGDPAGASDDHARQLHL